LPLPSIPGDSPKKEDDEDAPASVPAAAVVAEEEKPFMELSVWPASRAVGVAAAAMSIAAAASSSLLRLPHPTGDGWGCTGGDEIEGEEGMKHTHN